MFLSCRCFYLAQSYSANKKWLEASALFEKVFVHTKAARKEWKSVSTKPKEVRLTILIDLFCKLIMVFFIFINLKSMFIFPSLTDCFFCFSFFLPTEYFIFNCVWFYIHFGKEEIEIENVHILYEVCCGAKNIVTTGMIIESPEFFGPKEALWLPHIYHAIILTWVC